MEMPNMWKILRAVYAKEHDEEGDPDIIQGLGLMKEMAEALENISKMDWLNAISYHQQNKANEALKKFKEWK